MTYRIYSPIPDVAIIDVNGQRPGTLHVTACPGTPEPIAITLAGEMSASLTVEQLDVLMGLLGQARADAVRVLVAHRQEAS